MQEELRGAIRKLCERYPDEYWQRLDRERAYPEKFVGELNDRLRGFYRSQYTDIDGNERYMATTQFESTDARRAFPCWDEPSMKAKIELTLVVPAELTGVSNMPVVSEESVGPDKRSVRFGESPIMSTYLLVIVVGDLSLIEQEAPNGTLVRIFTMRGRQEQGRFALETSIRLLGYFNEYFGIPYPLPKLDHLDYTCIAPYARL